MSSNTLSNADQATADMASLCASMQREITSLRASQIAANREIIYLRRNQDRAVREISSEIKHLRSGVKVMQSQLQEMGESQKTLLRRVQRCEANASASGSASSSVPPSRAPTPSQSRHRRLGLRRQGAFRVEDINDVPWAELNDVRGFNPNSPRYHWSASSPSMHTSDTRTGVKRTRDADAADAAASFSFFDQFEPRRPVVPESDTDSNSDSEDGPSPLKRRRMSSAARIARITAGTKSANNIRRSVSSRPATSKNNTARRSTSFLAGVIAGVSSVFLS